MNRYVKTWMLWLLLLALPAQAQISVFQLSCDIGHQRQTGGHAMKLGSASSVKVSKQSKAIAGQHGAKQLKKAAKAPAQQADHSVCGPCATCCGASAALPNLNDVPAGWEISRQYLSPLPASHAGFIPGGLERPPRHHIA